MDAYTEYRRRRSIARREQRARTARELQQDPELVAWMTGDQDDQEDHQEGQGMTTTTVSPRDLIPGTRFPSPRASEGTVEVMCAYGECTHDERPDSVHVKGANGGQWFVPLIEREPVHVCEVATCWLDHPVVTVEMPWGETVESSHAEANAHHQ